MSNRSEIYIHTHTGEKVVLTYSERELGYFVFGKGGPLNTNFKATGQPARFVSESTWKIVLRDHSYIPENGEKIQPTSPADNRTNRMTRSNARVIDDISDFKSIT